MDTKKKILDAAQSLFNERGTPEITTRHIASEIGISQGNLHYHYPNKPDVIVKLYKKFSEEIKAAERFFGDVLSINDLLASMVDAYEIMYRYRFLFADRDYIWRTVPDLELQMLKLFDLKRIQINELIQLYEKESVFEDLHITLRESLLDQIMLLITSWIHSIPYTGPKPAADISRYYAHQTFKIWIPYLKPEQRQKWLQIL